MSLFGFRKRHIPLPENGNGLAIDIYNSLLDEHILPYLKDLGYKKKGRTFIKQRGEIYHIINFQSDKYNLKNEQKFYINVSVLSPEVHRVLTGNEPEPREYEGIIYARLDEVLSTYPADVTLYNNTDTTQLIARIIDAIDYVELNLFAHYATLKDLLIYLDRPKYSDVLIAGQINQIRAIVYGLLGDKASSRKEFLTTIASFKKDKGFADIVKRGWIRRCRDQAAALGIELTPVEVQGEACITFTFPITRKKPITDERRSINLIENKLFNLEFEKNKGYTSYYGSRAESGVYKLHFYTREPETVMSGLARQLDKVAIKPEVTISKDV